MKLSKDTLFKPSAPRAETLLDKTTRLAREIIDDGTEQRRLKTARLRKARMDQEADASAEAAKEVPTDAKKKPKRKAASKR